MKTFLVTIVRSQYEYYEVHANSEEEAIKVATDADKIDTCYGFTPKCYLIPELTANVDVPKVIKSMSYFE